MQRMGVLAVLVVGGVIGSGCAGKGEAQVINRLKSDVGILEQRVSQLERISLQQDASLSGLSDTSAASSASSSGEASAVTVAVAPATSPSVKPSKKEIQRALKNAGFYTGSVDGKIGPHTQEAIRQFQQAHGLKSDGIVGKQTWEQLAPYATIASDPSELGAAETLK